MMRWSNFDVKPPYRAVATLSGELLSEVDLDGLRLRIEAIAQNPPCGLTADSEAALFKRLQEEGSWLVLSPESEPFRIPFLLQTFGVGMPFFLDQNLVFRKIVALCMQFWTESSVRLQQAVAACNAAVGGARVRYAAVPFTVGNAVFASDPWLFGLSERRAERDKISVPFAEIERRRSLRDDHQTKNRIGPFDSPITVLP